MTSACMRTLEGAALALLLFASASAQSVHGIMLNTQGEPLIGGHVTILGTNTGVATNTDGMFEIKMRPGRQTLIGSFIGYLSDTATVEVREGERLRKDFRLIPSTIEIVGMDVYAGQYNSAEEVMLSAIARKERYLAAIYNYEYAAYSRTAFIPSAGSGKETIGGIAEVQSRGFFEAPGKFQEVVLAKRQTANFSDLFNIFSSGKVLSVLDDVLLIDELAVISPLNRRAMKYYRFAMIDTTFHEKRRVFNIAITPASDAVPLFEGRISIIDGAYTVVDLTLYGREKVKSTLKSDIVLHQAFREFEDFFWFPVQCDLAFTMDLGIPGAKKLRIKQSHHYTDYRFNSPSFKHRFDERLLRGGELSQADAESVWTNSQAVGLSTEEREAYHTLDSAMATKSFLLKALIKLPELYLKAKLLPVTEFSDFYSYNRVEGNRLGMGLEFKEILPWLSLTAIGGYGTADKRTKGTLAADVAIVPEHVYVNGSAFRQIRFLDPYYKYRRYDITAQQLLFNRDYADYYYAAGWQTGASWKVSEYVQTAIAYSVYEVETARNNAHASLFNRGRAARPMVDAGDGCYHRIDAAFTLDTRSWYDYGWGRIQNWAEDFVRLSVEYSATPHGVANGNETFEQYRVFVNAYTKISPWLNINAAVTAGRLTNDRVTHRLFHLPGSYGSLSELNQFRSLTTDTYAGSAYASVFLENNFKNTVFNILHLPFLMNSKYDLFLCGGAGWIERAGSGDHARSTAVVSEAGFGIGNILFYLRMNFTWRITPKEERGFFFTVGSTFN